MPSSERQMMPRELVIKIDSMGTPASCVSSAAAPRFAEPAPWNRYTPRRSSAEMEAPAPARILIAPHSPATATAAVPWMSSLYVRNLLR